MRSVVQNKRQCETGPYPGDSDFCFPLQAIWLAIQNTSPILHQNPLGKMLHVENTSLIVLTNSVNQFLRPFSCTKICLQLTGHLIYLHGKLHFCGYLKTNKAKRNETVWISLPSHTVHSLPKEHCYWMIFISNTKAQLLKHCYFPNPIRRRKKT